MPDEIKKKGRPALSPEEKAQRAEARKIAKREAYHANKAKKDEAKKIAAEANTVFTSVTQKLAPPTKSEQETIDEMERKIRIALEKSRAQYPAMKEQTEQVGNSEMVYISRATEPTIDDEYVDTRPPFIQKDEEGWQEI